MPVLSKWTFKMIKFPKTLLFATAALTSMLILSACTSKDAPQSIELSLPVYTALKGRVIADSVSDLSSTKGSAQFVHIQGQTSASLSDNDSANYETRSWVIATPRPSFEISLETAPSGTQSYLARIEYKENGETVRHDVQARLSDGMLYQRGEFAYTDAQMTEGGHVALTARIDRGSNAGPVRISIFPATGDQLGAYDSTATGVLDIHVLKIVTG